MSFNDRLSEAARWVYAHPGDTIALPKEPVALALRDAATNPGAWPDELSDWIKDTATPTAGPSLWSAQCWDAAVPADSWAAETEHWDDPDTPQPAHSDCPRVAAGGKQCLCPCHQQPDDDDPEAGFDPQAVYPCQIEHEQPYDFDHCVTHDRTMPVGGTCDHAGKSELDYLHDTGVAQRGRAAIAEERLNALTAALQRLATASDGTPAYNHTGHPDNEGTPECGGCWADAIVRFLAHTTTVGAWPFATPAATADGQP